MDDSFSYNDEIGKRPLLPKNLNLKNGITKYKMKLEEKKRLEKENKLIKRYEFDESKSMHSPRKWRSDTFNSGNFIYFIF